MLNQVVLLGKVVSVEKEETGQYYLLLEVERDFKESDGTFKKDILKCTLWRGIADSIRDYYQSGQVISVCGRLECDSSYRNIVIGEKISFLGRTKDANV